MVNFLIGLLGFQAIFLYMIYSLHRRIKSLDETVFTLCRLHIALTDLCVEEYGKNYDDKLE